MFSSYFLICLIQLHGINVDVNFHMFNCQMILAMVSKKLIFKVYLGFKFKVKDFWGVKVTKAKLDDLALNIQYS